MDLILRKWKPFLILLFFAFYFIFSFSSARAAVGLSIQPIKTSHTIEPGKSVFGKIQITNVSDEAVNIETKTEDFVPLAGTITIQFVGRAPGVTTVKDWITLEPAKPFVLKKGENKEITYTIKAPSDAEPGGHFGVIFFKATKLTGDKEEQLKIGTQVGMLVFVTIPGNFLQKGRILDFRGPGFVSGGPANFTINFENTGTVHFEPKGTINITNIFGRKVAEVPIEGEVVLPTGIRDLTIQWPAQFLLGRYKATAKIFDGDGNELTTQGVVFYAFPVWYGLAAIAVIILLFFGLKFLRSKVSIQIVKKQS